MDLKQKNKQTKRKKKKTVICYLPLRVTEFNVSHKIFSEEAMISLFRFHFYALIHTFDKKSCFVPYQFYSKSKNTGTLGKIILTRKLQSVETTDLQTKKDKVIVECWLL